MGIWSWLADKLHFILSYEAGFYMPTVLKVHPPLLQDYSKCNNARLISTQFLLQTLDPNERCLKNGLLSGGLNPRSFSHKSSALTTRPRLLAVIDTMFILMFFLRQTLKSELITILLIGRFKVLNKISDIKI